LSWDRAVFAPGVEDSFFVAGAVCAEGDFDDGALEDDDGFEDGGFDVADGADGAEGAARPGAAHATPARTAATTSGRTGTARRRLLDPMARAFPLQPAGVKFQVISS
jgi:hypothetical protein